MTTQEMQKDLNHPVSDTTEAKSTNASHPSKKDKPKSRDQHHRNTIMSHAFKEALGGQKIASSSKPTDDAKDAAKPAGAKSYSKPKFRKSGQKSAAKYKPEDDGVTHINIHVDAKTKLGQQLSHFVHLPFTHPRFGPFNSMEGFWFYVLSEKPDDRLRSLYGFKAKKLGRTMTMVRRDNFNELIMEANFYKIDQNEELKKMMIESTLPFDLYYIFGDDKLQIHLKGAPWLSKGFEEIRQMLRDGRRPVPVDYDV